MKIRKRFVVMGSIALFFMVLVGCSPHFGLFGGRFHHRPGYGGDMPAFVLGRLDGKVEELYLAPAQKVKYDEVRAVLKAHLSAAKEDRKKFKELARAELAKKSPDVAVLTDAMKKKIQGISGTVQNDLDLLASFYSVLDETQKRKVIAGIRKKMAKMDRCRED